MIKNKISVKYIEMKQKEMKHNDTVLLKFLKNPKKTP